MAEPAVTSRPHAPIRDALWIGGLTSAVVIGLGTITGLLLVPSNAYLSSRVGGTVDLDLSDRLRVGLITATQTVGVPMTASRNDPGGDVEHLHLAVQMVPTTLLLVVIWVVVRSFRWRTAGYRSPIQALPVMLGAATLCGLVMTAVALIATRVISLDSDPDGPLGLDLSQIRIRIGPSPVAAMVITTLTVLIVTTGAALTRRDWLSGPTATRLHDLGAIPLRGVALLVGLLPLLGLVTLLAILAVNGGGSSGGPDPQELKTYVVAGLAWGGNLGVWALSLGLWGRAGVSAGLPRDLASLAPDGTTSRWVHLPTVADWTGNGIWVVVVLAPATLLALAWAVRVWSPPALRLRNALVAMGSMVVVIPLLTWLANAHARGQATVVMYGDWKLAAVAGSAVWEMIALAMIWFALISAVVLAAEGDIDPHHPLHPNADPNGLSGPSTPGSGQGPEAAPLTD